MVVHDYTIQSIKELAETNSLPPDEYLAGLLDEDKRRKEMDTLAMQCWYTLSDREKQVTALICAGLSTYQIAERIGTASSTVKTHLKKIYVKFQVHSRKELREKLSNYDLSRFE